MSCGCLLQVVHKAALLPALRDGDWLMFPFAGAYTICAASNYGGVRFTQPDVGWLRYARYYPVCRIDPDDPPSVTDGGTGDIIDPAEPLQA